MPVAEKLSRDTKSNYANIQKNADVSPEILILNWPQAAQDRYARTMARWQMAKAKGDQVEAQREQDRNRKDDAVTQLYTLKESYSRFGKLAPKAEIEKLETQVRFFHEKCSVIVPNEIQMPHLDGIDSYIRAYNGVPVMADVDFVDDATPELLAEAEADLSALKKLLGKVERAPRPKAACEASVIGELDVLEKAGKPGLNSMQYHLDQNERTGRFQIQRGGDYVEWPLKHFRPGDADDYRTFDSLSFHVWLNRDAIQEKLLAEIRARKDEGLSPEDKAAKVRDLHEKIAAAMRRIDAILMALESQGGFKWRRVHFHPAILLGIEVSDASRIAEHTP